MPSIDMYLIVAISDKILVYLWLKIKVQQQKYI